MSTDFNEYSQIYRYTDLGVSLSSLLEDLKHKNKLSDKECRTILNCFDKAVISYIKKNKDKLPEGNIEGHLDIYNELNNIWKLQLSNVILDIDHNNHMDLHSITIISSKLSE